MFFLTEPDRNRLVNLVRRPNAPESADNTRAKLVARMDEATIVALSAIPETVVTMNSIVQLIDMPSGERVIYTLVYPGDANVDQLKISVLSPLGVALLGQSEGAVVEFTAPSGTKRYVIEKVVYQPEAQLRDSGEPS